MPMSAFLPEPVIEVQHGRLVIDPFRWLEDRSSDRTVAWIEEQALNHAAYFALLEDLQAVRSRVSSLLNGDTFDQLVRLEHQLFYRRRRINQEQGCICVVDGDASQERILVDPAPRGRFASVAIHRISDDGSLLAYELKRGGTDSKEIHVVAVRDGRELTDPLPAGLARGLVFAPNGSGFYYSHDRVESVGEHSICFRQFRDGSQDVVLLRRPRTLRSRLLLGGDDVHLSAAYIWEDRAALRVDLHLGPYSRQPLWQNSFAGRSAPYWPIVHKGRIFVWSEDGAPNGKVIELAADGSILRAVVPESEAPIHQVARVADRFFVRYLLKRQWVIRSWTLDGIRAEDISLPERGTVQILPVLSNRAQSLFYSYESFTEPLQVWEQPMGGRKARIVCQPSATLGLHDLRIDEVTVHSRDGADIPMTMVMRCDVEPMHSHVAIMTSYGGFGVPMTPQFSVLVALLVECGAIFAVPSIRGGGDFGRTWHESGRRRQRQVAIDDFLSAAEHVSTWNTTSSRSIGIFGGSNSGLLVAAAMTQRPNLFRAVLCIAPLLDMVRHEQFDRACKWRDEYGSVADPEDFVALYNYSPYHRVQADVNYPAVLFVTGDCDNRCNPAHVRKMAARLQSRAVQTNPVLVDYSAERGHSPVLPLSTRTDALSRRVAFLAHELGLSVSFGGQQ